MKPIVLIAVGLLACAAATAQSVPLIVVEDRGGVSALPYYQPLNTQADTTILPVTPSHPRVGTLAEAEAMMLPVRSAHLTPGEVPHRVISAPGLTPLFLVGDDARSRIWLQQHHTALREMGAVGLVVNVESATALAALRRLAPGLTLAPTAGDDLAQRLGLRHYPALITATGIEQ